MNHTEECNNYNDYSFTEKCICDPDKLIESTIKLMKSKEKQLIVYQTLQYENNQVRQLVKCTKQNCNDCSIINPNEPLDSYYNDNGLCVLHSKIRLKD